MPLTPIQTIIIILCISAGTIITRFLPFALFPENKKRPKIIEYLSTAIPPAMIGLLVVYCLKGTSIRSFPHGIPELIALAVTAVLHLRLKHSLLSIGAGTVCYMILVQFVFI